MLRRTFAPRSICFAATLRCARFACPKRFAPNDFASSDRSFRCARLPCCAAFERIHFEPTSVCGAWWRVSAPPHPPPTHSLRFSVASIPPSMAGGEPHLPRLRELMQLVSQISRGGGGQSTPTPPAFVVPIAAAFAHFRCRCASEYTARGIRSGGGNASTAVSNPKGNGFGWLRSCRAPPSFVCPRGALVAVTPPAWARRVRRSLPPKGRNGEYAVAHATQRDASGRQALRKLRRRGNQHALKPGAPPRESGCAA